MAYQKLNIFLDSELSLIYDKKEAFMFRQAQLHSDNLYNDINQQLITRLEQLEKTATTWFDDTSSSVAIRKGQLFSVSGLCQRVASISSDDDLAELQVLAENLSDQARKLATFEQELRFNEYHDDHGDGSPRFSSRGLLDEARIAATRQTDWDLFLGIEPREFVSNNKKILDNPEELRIRAMNFMEDSLTGHGLSRKAKIEITTAFLAEVEQAREDSE